MLKRIFFVVTTFIATLSLTAQNTSVLFSVGNIPVSVDEFNYIYNKNNRQKADYSEASVREYLDLYATFKMKVQRARDTKIDTISVLKKELEGYRAQLSKNYLTDREVLSRLTHEAYDRMQKDVAISHIFVKVAANAAPSDTLAAFKKIQEAYKALKSGKRFGNLAKEFSEDEANKNDGGRIGYITVLQLPNFYELETAAYNTPVGKYSAPIRTRVGYHILQVDDVRKARGELQIAHILVRVNDKAKDEVPAQEKINRLFRDLQGGASFEDLAKLESEDEQNASKGGYIGLVGIGQYETAFEEAAFRLEKDGDYCRPFRSSVGWHILKRQSKMEMESFDDLKGRLENKIRRDNRFKLAQEALIKNIKKEANFKVVDNVFAAFNQQLDATFMTYQWLVPIVDSGKPLFNLGGKVYTLGDFVTYLQRANNSRVKYANEKTPQEAGELLFENFVDSEALTFEESRLEDKYPDFANLMREYREGILLFEITKMEVWDKASQDSIGLQQFYDKNKSKYQWGERAEAVIYTLNSSDANVIKAFQKYAKKKSPQQVIEKFNKTADIVTFETGIFEKGKNSMVDATLWKAGMLSDARMDDNKQKFVKIERVFPVSIKPLDEAKGYVTADYQEYLEKTWIADLKKSYPVKVDEDVLKSILK